MSTRRSFLKAIAVLPLVPAAVRGWAEEQAEALEEPGAVAAPAPPDLFLAYAEGEPAAVTVVVDGRQAVKVTGAAFMAGVDGGSASLTIMEGKTPIATTANSAPQVRSMHVGAVVRPAAGCHTYKLAFRGNVVMDRAHRPAIWVERAHA